MHSLDRPKPLVQSATDWSASVHSLDRPKPVKTLLFNALRNGVPRCIDRPKPVKTLFFNVLGNGVPRCIV